MSLPIPNLDDRNFEALVEEARSLIPVYSREWTNHNTSDPGITLLELFAWLTEILVYRSNQIPEATYRRYLKLLGTDELFCWERLPGTDNPRLIDFLTEKYELDWLKTAVVRKTGDGRIEVANGDNQVRLQLVAAESKVGVEERALKVFHPTDGASEPSVCMAVTVDVAGGPKDELLVKEEWNALFDWQCVPGKDNYKLRDFLRQYYGAAWVQRARIEKGSDHNRIRIADDCNTIDLHFDPMSREVAMVFDTGRHFTARLHFDWSQVPGEGNRRLLHYLYTQISAADWVRNAKVERSDDQTVVVSKGENRLTIRHTANDSKLRLSFEPGVALEFSVKHRLDGFFDWDRFDISDQAALRGFLQRHYGLEWVNEAKLVKDPLHQQIVLEGPGGKIFLRTTGERDAAIFRFKVGDTFRFSLREHSGSLKVYQKLEADLLRGIRELSKLTRAVTAEDYEALTRDYLEWLKPGLGKASRVICVPNRDWEFGLSALEKPGHISVILIPGADTPDLDWEDPGDQAQLKLRELLWVVYRLEWIKTGRFTKEGGGNLFRISHEGQALFLHRSLREQQIRMAVSRERLELEVRYANGMTLIADGAAAEASLFCWEYLPGVDNPQLKEYLKRTYGVGWVKQARVERLGPEWVTVALEDQMVLLHLDRDAAKLWVYYTEDSLPLETRLENKHTCVYGYTKSFGNPSALLRQTVLDYLNGRRLLTTRVHVVDPVYQAVKLEVTVALKQNTHPTATLDQALQAVQQYFDPVSGGPEGRGWPMGRSLYRSEVCALVEGISGIDHIVKVIINDDEEAEMAQVAENQLVAIDPVLNAEKVYHG